MDATASKPSSRRFSISQLALILPWVAIVIDAWGPIGDNSFLWHVRAGTAQAASVEVLTTDPFSFTRNGESWLTQSWLAELLYGWLEDYTRLAFVPWMILAVMTLTFVGIGLVGYRQSRNVTGTAFVLLLSTILLLSFMVPRPVIFSFLLFVLVILSWDNPRLRWAVPFLFWIWASVHGSFFIGLAYVGLSIVTHKEWKALPSAVLAGVATLATAHGLGVVDMLVDFARARDTLSLLTEWRRPTLLSSVFLPFAGGVAIVVIGAYRQLIAPRHLWLLIPFLLLGISSVRAVPAAWLGILPLVALSMSDMELGTKRRFSTVSAAIFALAVVLIPVPLAEPAELDDERFPLEARTQLADVPTFHDDRAGGYLIWAEWPQRLVYLDDRAELYRDRMLEFVEVRSGDRDWRPVFERDGVEQALLRADEDLIQDLQDSGWQTEHHDEVYVVLRPES